MTVEPQPIRLSPWGKFITVAIIVGLGILLIRSVGSVITPFLAAAITAYLFNPLISWLHRRSGVGRAYWILVLYVLVGALIYGLIRFLGPILSSQYRELVARIPGIVEEIQREISANHMIEIGGILIDVGPLEEPLINLVEEIGRGLPLEVPHLFLRAIETVLLFVTYLLVTFYFLLQAEQIMEQIYALVPPQYRAEIRGLGKQIDYILAGYVRGTLLLIPIMSILTWIALTILDVPYALVIAIASGVLEIIPLIGPWSAALIAMTVSLFQETPPWGWSNGLLALVVGITYFVLRMFEDNFIIPHVVGHAVHLHPVLVLFAILAGGVLGGPFGLLISIPSVAIVQLLLRYLYRKLVDAPELPPPDLSPPKTTEERVADAKPAVARAESQEASTTQP